MGGDKVKVPRIFAGLLPPEFDIKPPQRRRRYVKSTFGPQCLSSRVTEPSIGFGRGVRIGIDKLYIDAEHAKLTPGQSPGPIYEVLSSVGKQVKSDNENPPEIGFAGSRRFARQKASAIPGPGAYETASSFGEQVLSYQKSPEKAIMGSSTRAQQNHVYLSADFNKTLYGLGSPGPTVCDLRSSLGDQMHSENRNAPHIKFSKDKRFKEKSRVSQDTPGVGMYKVIGAVGKQPESHKSNLPVISFTHANRKAGEKVYISVDHEKAKAGLDSPGPAMRIKVMSSLGQQINSKKGSPPCWGFGSGKRFRRVIEILPGPGEYDC